MTLIKVNIIPRVLAFNGFNVYRFWEHEINEDVKGCINKLMVEIKKLNWFSV